MVALIDGGVLRSKCNEALRFGGGGMVVVGRVAGTPIETFVRLADVGVHAYLVPRRWLALHTGTHPEETPAHGTSH